jgi:4'-phosphopantetheinyl transferase EntD
MISDAQRKAMTRQLDDARSNLTPVRQLEVSITKIDATQEQREKDFHATIATLRLELDRAGAARDAEHLAGVEWATRYELMRRLLKRTLPSLTGDDPLVREIEEAIK